MLRGKNNILLKPVVKMYKAGLSLKEIAAETGRSTSSIRAWLRRENVYVNSYFNTEDTKQEIVRLYVDEKIGIPTIGRKLNLNNASVRGVLVVKGIARRTPTEAHSLTANKRKYPIGKGGYWQSQKTGQWEYAQSTYELTRMSQLDEDPSIKTWDRQSVPRITYGENKTYVPDFFIEYHNGSIVIEEVKPVAYLNNKINMKKFAVATEYCKRNNMLFRIITEKEIGIKYLRQFKAGGLQQCFTEEVKKAYSKQYYEKNKEKILANSKINYEKNKDKRSVQTKEWQRRNKDKCNSYSQACKRKKYAVECGA